MKCPRKIMVKIKLSTIRNLKIRDGLKQDPVTEVLESNNFYGWTINLDDWWKIAQASIGRKSMKKEGGQKNEKIAYRELQAREEGIWKYSGKWQWLQRTTDNQWMRSWCPLDVKRKLKKKYYFCKQNYFHFRLHYVLLGGHKVLEVFDFTI